MRHWCIAVTLSVGLSLATSWHGAPPTDEQVERAVETYAAASKGLDQSQMAERISAADNALASLDLAGLTPAQVTVLIRGQLLPTSSKSGAIFEALSDAARAETVDGADAAAVRLLLLRLEPDASAQQHMIARALTHPKLKDALLQGRATAVFGGSLGAGKMMLKEVLGVGELLAPEMPSNVIARSHLLLDAVISIAGEEATEKREPLREKVAALIAAARAKEPADSPLAETLALAERKVNGAYMKGTLIGGPAPDLTITWCSSTPALASLSELKGKVVVLDFWATWFGGCVTAIPHQERLKQRYEGLPVAFVGVTSLQGFHVDEGNSTDCTGDPEKEMSLMGEFVKAKGITRTIVFSKESVYNPEYGVTAIPHLVIIDAKGNVRHRKLHPNDRQTPFAEKVRMIDDLLKEAGVPPPG